MSHFCYLPTPLLPGSVASHLAARAHTQTIRRGFAFFSNSLTAFLLLALSLFLFSLFHTGTRLPPTNPHPSHHKKAEGRLCSLHLLLAFGANNADTAPTVIAPHVSHGPTCFVSSFTTSSYKKLQHQLGQQFGLLAHISHTKAREHTCFLLSHD